MKRQVPKATRLIELISINLCIIYYEARFYKARKEDLQILYCKGEFGENDRRGEQPRAVKMLLA